MSAGFNFQSKKEIDESKTGGTPLVAENYICKVVKVELRKAPTFANGTPNWKDLTLSYCAICLPVCPKGGTIIRDINGKEVKPLTRWLFKNFSPFSWQFTREKEPAALRAFIGYMMGLVNLEDGFLAEKGVLIDKDLNIIDDDALMAKYSEERNNPSVPNVMLQAGYRAIPDARIYEGRYIACDVETDSVNGVNKVTHFRKLPEGYQPPKEDPEALEQFEKSYAKMKEKQNEKYGGGDKVNEVSETSEEIVLEDVKF
jgi:hypothetical protein